MNLRSNARLNERNPNRRAIWIEASSMGLVWHF